MIFDGFLKVCRDKSSPAENISATSKGKRYDLVALENCEQKYLAPPRYNEATLVKILEEYGMSRPSTYAPTISTIIEEKYVDKKQKRKDYSLSKSDIQ